MKFHQLKLNKRIRETADAVTLEFEVPDHLQAAYQYQHGQYITLKLMLDGEEIRRSYSMSSSPHQNRLAITVKKVHGGKASVYLTDEVQEGQLLEVGTPEGRFTISPDLEKRRTYYLFAAGSGITPIISIARELLEAEPMCTIFLLYGSRNEESIIFRNELDRLSERYRGQMHVEYIISQPKIEVSGGGLFGLFKKTSYNWKGKRGRIDARFVRAFLDENMVQGAESDAHYFICGPGDMIEVVRTTLLGRGISEKQIHTEYFINAGQIPGSQLDAAAPALGGKKLIAHIRGKKIETHVPDGATILDVLVKEKHDPPYSCTSGACATCMAKVLNGKATMEVCYALDDDEVKAGYILTCQARPDSPELEISYDM